MWKWVGLGKLYVGVGGFGITFWMQVGLVKLYMELSRIDQTFCGCEWDWFNFLQEQVELVKLSAGAAGIGHNSFREGQNGIQIKIIPHVTATVWSDSGSLHLQKTADLILAHLRVFKCLM